MHTLNKKKIIVILLCNIINSKMAIGTMQTWLTLISAVRNAVVIINVYLK